MVNAQIRWLRFKNANTMVILFPGKASFCCQGSAVFDSSTALAATGIPAFLRSGDEVRRANTLCSDVLPLLNLVSEMPATNLPISGATVTEKPIQARIV